MKKRILSWLLVLCLVLSSVPATVFASQVTASGTCGDNLTWTLDDGGVLKISGTGEMTNWQSSLDTPWEYYRDMIKTVVVESGITSIGSRAFSYCRMLTNVSLPDSIKAIGTSSFSMCDALTAVTLPAELTTIAMGAFSNSGLISVNIPEKVSSIGTEAFGSCDDLEEVVVSNDNIYYQSQNGVLFNDDLTTLVQCPAGKVGEYNIPSGVTTISKSAFVGCGELTDILLPDSVEYVGDGAFQGCDNLTSIIIPNKVTTINNYVFQGCNRLKSIILPNGITSIGEQAFGACALTDITLPQSVKSIGNHTFVACSSLNSITLSDGMKSIAYGTFYDCSSLRSIVIPNGITDIAGNAFYNCSSLSEVTFVGSAPTISADAFTNVTATCYYPDCDASWNDTVKQNYGGTITWVAYANEHVHEYDANHKCECGAIGGTCGDSLTWTLDQEGTLIVSGTGKMMDWQDSENIADKAPWYIYRDQIKTVIIEKGVTRIGDLAFFKCEMSNIVLPDTIESIGWGAFYWCGNLKSVPFKGNAPTIGELAFYGVTATCYYPAGDPTWTDVIMQKYDGTITWVAVDADGEPLLGAGKCGENLYWTLDEEGLLTISGMGAMSNFTYPDFAPWRNVCKSIREVVAESGVTSIGNTAFQGCSNLETISIPATMTTIGDYAFYDCDALTSIVIPNNVTSIGEAAFAECAKLSSINIPNGITIIRMATFANCPNLTDIVIPNTVTTLEWCAFSGTGCSSIYIPDSVTNIDRTAFGAYWELKGDEGCGISENLKQILVDPNNNVYANDAQGVLYTKDMSTLIRCPSGYSGEFVVPSGVTTIGEDAFNCCKSITQITMSDSITKIEEYAFSGCSGITEIKLPRNLSEITASMLTDCTWLKKVEIPGNIERIWCAFRRCPALSEVLFLGSAPSIDSDAFYEVTATCRYPANDSTWVGMLSNYGGKLTWEPYCNGNHIYVEDICTGCGQLHPSYIPLESMEWVATQVIDGRLYQIQLNFKEAYLDIGYGANIDQFDTEFREALLEAYSQGAASVVLIDGTYYYVGSGDGGSITYSANGKTVYVNAGDQFNLTLTRTAKNQLTVVESSLLNLPTGIVLTCCGDTHDWVHATCTTPKTCSICGITDGNALGHNYKADTTNPSCTEDGFCTSCGSYEPCSGSGTEVSPYLISNAGQLYWFADEVNNGNTNIHGKLIANIVVNENVLSENGKLNGTPSRVWTPIGSKSNGYTGTFDGDNHTVSGLYHNDSSAKYVGLLGYVNGGIVKNVGILDSYLTGGWAVGGVVGYNDCGPIENCYITNIENCYNTGTVTGSEFVGGVVGETGFSTIKNCYNTGNITGSNRSVGGVAGEIYEGCMENCHNTGTVVGNSSAGGLVGLNKGILTNCYNTGTVTGSEFVGGVIGSSSISTLTNCYNTGAVTGNSTVGGVAGSNSDTIENCYNAGAVSGSQNGGGVAGKNSGTISNCYFDSDVYSSNVVGVNDGAVDELTGGKTTEQFTSGEVTYLLNGDQIAIVFKQTIGTDASPNFTGLQVYLAKNCGGKVTGYSNTESQANLEHTYTIEVEGTYKAATCMAAGSVTMKCANCGATKDEALAIDPNNHSEVIDAATEADCEDTGLTEGKHCGVCGKVIIAQEVVPAKGHALGEWMIGDGKSRRECTDCDFSETKVTTSGGTDVSIESSDDSDAEFEVEEVVNPEDERYILVEETLNDDDVNREILNIFDITMEEKGIHVQPDGTVKVKLPVDWDKRATYKVYYVDDDGNYVDMKAYRQGSHLVFETDHFSLYVLVEETIHEHEYDKVVTTPTCTAKGYTTYTCACGHSYTGDEVAALGHSEVTDKGYAATCTETGLSDGKHCARCDTVLIEQEAIPALGHSWDEGKVTTEPTEESAGVRTYTCGTCEETKTETIPALEHVHSYTANVTEPTCTEKGYTTYTCTCGDSFIADEIPATGHVIENGICTACGVGDPAEADLFELYGANMLLGNNLAMNFYIEPADLEFGEGYYAVITKTYADREDLEIIIEDDEWEEAYNMYRVSLDKIAAKEMADEITVVIYNDEDEQISKTWVDSVRDYTMRVLVKEEAKTTSDKELLALYVEMLNYGAAAQDHFNYNEDDLANNELTAAQQAYGLGTVEMENFRVEGTGYVGTNLVLESNILMNFFFNNIPAEHDDMYAIATYTDHYGEAKQVKVEGEDFVKHNSTIWKVSVSGLVVADCRELVSVKVYEADGDVIGSVTDSIESYTARMDGDSPLYVAIMNFAVAAYESFH